MGKIYEEGYTQNRELSWLRFNDRVLDEAMNVNNPTFERLNFVSIFSSNLDEFFQIRVGGLILDGEDEDKMYDVDELSGLSPEEQLKGIYWLIPKMLAKKDKVYANVKAKLSKEGLVRVYPNELTPADKKQSAKIYTSEIKDKIDYRIISSPKEMPKLNAGTIYVIARTETGLGSVYLLANVPQDIPSYYIMDNAEGDEGKVRYMLTKDMVVTAFPSLFKNNKIEEMTSFIITKNGDVRADEDAENLLKEMKKVVRKRKNSAIDRLVYDTEISDDFKTFLYEAMDIVKWQSFRTDNIWLGYVGDLRDAITDELAEKICYPKYVQRNQLEGFNGSIIDRVKTGDIISSYPYDSMDPFLKLLEEASTDPRVSSIKITIYRLSSHPSIVEHLINAVNNGKKVKVLMEIRARFDEAKNIEWTEKLKEAGVKVYFGNNKYKVHSKLCLVTLKEGDRKSYITQVATGNYNEKTAKIYTDLSLITYDRRIGKDAKKFFDNVLNKDVGSYKHLMTSPLDMKKNLIKMIRAEAAKKKDGFIFFKCNSISDEDLIEELMEASCAGCEIKMIVRGISCILPGVEYCTENISIVNVVGRYLEHSRIYIFGRGNEEKMFISSADWMKRNMEKRVEVACPIFNTDVKAVIREIMNLNYTDNVQGRKMLSDGRYSRKIIGSGDLIDSQKILMEKAHGKA